MSRREIKAYTIVQERYGTAYKVFAITSESSRRVNGHFVDNPQYGSHVTEKECLGRILDLKDAEARIAAVEAERARLKPGVESAYNTYVELDNEMRRALRIAAKGLK